MSYTCKHFVEPFFDDDKKPTKKQIAKYKLYQCEKCHKWFSFLDGRRAITE